MVIAVNRDAIGFFKKVAARFMWTRNSLRGIEIGYFFGGYIAVINRGITIVLLG